MLRQRLPADEDVVGRLAFEDELERGLQLFRGLQLGVAAGFLGGDGGLLAANPIAEVGEGELLQTGVGELVIVHQRAETVLETVPDVPDEGAMMEERAMLLEESVAQPVLQRSAGVIHLGEQGFLPGGVPILAVGAGESSRRRSAAGPSPLAGLMGTMPSSSASVSRPSGPSAGQSGKLEPVWRGHW